MAHIQRFINSNRQTLKKTLSYYVMHITVAAVVAFMVTGNILMAITLSMLEPSVQAIAFFFHERAWTRKEQKIIVNSEVIHA